MREPEETVVRLPVVAPPAAERARRSARAETEKRDACRILVVDDNIDSAESLATLLKVMGHDVRTAHDGFAGLEAVAVFSPQLVVLDIGMPRMNGYEVARRIRQQFGEQRIFLAALTGWGQDEDKQKALAQGFDRHLTKPVDSATLAQLLQAVALEEVSK